MGSLRGSMGSLKGSMGSLEGFYGILKGFYGILGFTRLEQTSATRGVAEGDVASNSQGQKAVSACFPSLDNN